MRAWLRRLGWLLRRDDFTAGLNEEMRLHQELRARRFEQQGIDPREAGYMARRQFGNSASVLDAASAAWGWGWWDRLSQDLRVAARMLRKAPGFTAIAIATLAVGLGINTAIFSVANAVMLRPLPYRQPERLIALWEETTPRRPDIASSHGSQVGSAGGPSRIRVSVANLVDYRKTASFDGLASYDGTAMNLTGTGTPERVFGELIWGGYFDVLGVSPALGRVLTAEDDRPDAPLAVILSHEFWQRRLGGETNILDRSIMFDGRPYRVIGVMPPGFRALSEFGSSNRPDFFVSGAYPADLLANHGDHGVNVVGRLRAGVEIRQAQAELDGISAGLARQFPGTNTGLRAVVAPVRDDLTRGFRDSLWALLGASGLIVLITSLNIANLLLVRSVARRHESSVRIALGAGRFRIARQFLAESLLLAGAGCVAGVALGAALLRLLVALAPADLPQIRGVGMDWRVYAVGAAVATLCGLFFGLAPAWQASGAAPVDSLRAASRSTGGRAQVRWRAGLTIVEVSMALVLMVGAGLLLKSFVRLMGVDLGFQPDRVLAMNVTLPEVRYPTALQRLQFYEQLERRVAGLPGVQSVAYANRMPLRGGWGSTVEVDAAPGFTSGADFQAVSAGYLETLGLSLVRGRFFTPADRDGAPHVAVVNLAFARQRFNGSDPIGHRIRRSGAPWVQIVGVVNDIRRGGKADTINPQVYLPAGQTALYPVRITDLAVRAAANPRHLVNAIQEQIWALDKDQPVTNVRTMEEIVSASVAQRRFQTLLLATFAGVAVILAMVGIFGVLSYAVRQRVQELGIRLALGARPGDILKLVMTQAGMLVAAGVAGGIVAAVALTRYLQSLLFQVQATDLASFVAAAALLAVCGLTAALVPAWRGSRVNPLSALRTE